MPMKNRFLCRTLGTALILLSFPAAAADNSQEILRALGSGFGKASTTSMVIVGVVLIALLAGITAWEISRADSRKRERQAVGWRYFSELAQGKGLTAVESEILKRIVEAGGLSSADMIFESAHLYEDALTAYLEKVASRLEKDPTHYVQLRGLRLKMGYARLQPEVPLTSTRQFDPGTPVKIILPGADEGEAVKGVILDVNENSWGLEFEDKALVEKASPGDKLGVFLLRSGDGEYRVHVRIRGLKLSAGAVYLDHARDLERKQLRNWVRVDVNIPCRVTVIQMHAEFDDSDLPVRGTVIEGRLIDLSGGGACARFASPLPRGCRLSLNFDLPGTSLRGIRADVMRFSVNNRGGRDQFEHNLKFDSLETAAQEKVVRYVFEKQRLDSQLRGTGQSG